MSDKAGHQEGSSEAKPLAQGPRTILSSDLFGSDLATAEKIVIIRHGQEEYRLRITAAGKLILTK